MTIFMKATLLGAASAMLLGCDRTAYESAPVTLNHAAGPVTCQLYTVDRVMWDHALTFPDGIEQVDADALCFEEGERRLAEYKAAQKSQK